MRNPRLLLLILLVSSLAISQEIEQFQVFAGRFDYLAIGNTLNATENGTGALCELLPESSAVLNLDADQSIIAAYLYWAGSGTGDFDVTLNGTPITATRTFATDITNTRFYFAAFADVTQLVTNEGAIEYTFGGADLVDLSDIYCSTATNFAGWSIVVVYEDMDLPLNQVNVFDGLESVSSFSPSLSISLDNLNVTDNEDAKIGFIAWEGDRGLAVNETLSINGNILDNPPLNPFNNQFNGTNSFTGSDQLFNMDIDVYGIQNNINIGDESAMIEITSGQDFVMINSVVTVLNSQLPDAIVSINNMQTACNSRDVVFDYMVTNQGSDILPDGVSISFYADDIFIGTSVLPVALDLGESFQETITITINQAIPNNFVLQAIVDDPATSIESNEENNESNEISITLESLFVGTLEDVFICDDASNDGIGIFNLLETTENAILGQENILLEFYTSMNDAENQINPILSPESYQNIVNQQPIYVRFSLLDSGNCEMIFSFEINVSFQPEIPTIAPLRICDDASNDGIGSFDLSILEGDLLEPTILAGQNPADFTITFHNTQEGANTSTGNIVTTTDVSLTNGDSVFARIENNNNPDCLDTTEIMVFVDVAPFANSVATQVLCDDPSNDDIEDFDLTGLDLIILGDQNPVDFIVTFHGSQQDANTNTAAITPITAVPQTNGSSLFARVENNNNPNCFDTTTIMFLVDTALVIEPIPDQIVCDDISNDGIENFDLSTLEIIVPGLQNPDDFVTTFYSTEEDANTSTGSLINIASVPLANGDSVFARYQSETFDSCFGITEIAFIVNALPIANSAPDQMVCDDLSNDGIASFDLRSQDAIIINNQSDVFISYYITLEDAEMGVNPISNPDNYTNTANPQMIYTRLENELNASCFDVGFFDIGVLPIEDVMIFESLESCSEGFEIGTFDLTSNPDLEGIPSDLIVYYTTLEDAADQVNPITNPIDYQNESNPDEIYVRIQADDELDCFSVGFFDISIIPIGIEDVLSFEPLESCNEGFEMGIFNLTSNPDFEGIPSDLITGYYTTLEDVVNQTNPIPNPTDYQNTSNPEVVYVRIESDNELDCFEIAKFTLEIENCPPFVPEGFSPNGDGLNDIFEISRLKNVYDDYKLYIYSRLGNLIYEGDNNIAFWNGIPNRGIGGTLAPTGVYYWVLELNDPEISDQVGWVYLNR